MASEDNLCKFCEIAARVDKNRARHCWGVVDCYHLAMYRIAEKHAYLNVHGEPQVLWHENYWLDRSTTGRE